MMHCSYGSVIDIRKPQTMHILLLITQNTWEILSDDYEINIDKSDIKNIEEKELNMNNNISDITTIDSSEQNYENLFC